MEKRILVADDSEEVRDFLRTHFQTLGFGVRTANSGEEVLKLLAEEAPDLLILDVMMPNPNGFQVCRRIKADAGLRDLPVLMLTARSRAEDVYWGKDCGADDYLTKPFRTMDLEFKVEKLLAGRRPQGRPMPAPLRWVQVEQELRSRNGNPRELVHCFLKWNDRAASVFRKKYGEVQFGEAMEKIFEILRILLEGESLTAGIEFETRRGIQLLLQADRERGESLAKKIAFHLNHLLRSYYTREDLEREGVVFRKMGSRRETRVPLLEFKPSLNFYPSC